jgi:hypothetical protein
MAVCVEGVCHSIPANPRSTLRHHSFCGETLYMHLDRHDGRTSHYGAHLSCPLRMKPAPKNDYNPHNA